MESAEGKADLSFSSLHCIDNELVGNNEAFDISIMNLLPRAVDVGRHSHVATGTLGRIMQGASASYEVKEAYRREPYTKHH